MTPTIVTALTGFFVFAGVGGISTTSLLGSENQSEPTYQMYSVAMTGYNAVAEQTDSDPTTTASGAYSNSDIIAARSVDLADELPFGTVIAVTIATSTSSRKASNGGANCGLHLVSEQIGLRVIGDSMHPRMRNKIDIMFDPNDTVRARGRKMNPALVLGKCNNIQIAVVGYVDIRHVPKTQSDLRLAIGFDTINIPQTLAVK